jgi:hypothetical protein
LADLLAWRQFPASFGLALAFSFCVLSQQLTEQRSEVAMKIQNIFRHAIAVGFGVAMMWASMVPVRAQEIVNTQFPDGPYVSSLDQNAANVPGAPATAAAVPSNSTISSAVPTPAVAEQAVVSLSDSISDILIASSLFGLLLFVLYALAEIRRNSLHRASASRPHFSQGAALS